VTFDNSENPFHLVGILENVPERLLHYEPFAWVLRQSAGRAFLTASSIFTANSLFCPRLLYSARKPLCCPALVPKGETT
jgi:hypothetical protein